jgi:glycogen synthase
MRNGMNKDFSWNASAKEYIRVYERVRQGRGSVTEARSSTGNASLALV